MVHRSSMTHILHISTSLQVFIQDLLIFMISLRQYRGYCISWLTRSISRFSVETR